MWCLPVVALAHTRWFADPHVQPFVSEEPSFQYMLFLLSIAFGVLVFGWWFHQHDRWRLKWLRPTGPQAYERAAATFAMVCGAFFVIAGTHSYLFSPNQTVESGVPNILVSIQIAIGLAFLVGIAVRTSAVALGMLWLSSFFFVGSIATLENVWVLSTAAFIAIMGNDYFSLWGVSFLRKPLWCYRPYALSILRIGTGLTLFVLGFSEKLFAPEFGMSFLSHHHWNFMSSLGFAYSDYLFVLSAGTVEMMLGLFFMLGILTRLTALIATILFTIPLFLLGPIELAGHLPHFAAIILLLLFGSGGKFLLVKSYRDALWQPDNNENWDKK